MFSLTTPSFFTDVERFPFHSITSRDPTADPKCLKMDMVENDKEYTAVFDVPGVKKEDVHVNVEGHRLSVSVDYKDEHKGEEDEDGNKVHWRERHVGHVSRTIQLPNNVNMSTIEAKQNDGVLKIHFQKSPDEDGSRRITVN
mmetsp:Transcript_14539/g.16495  ORF Transcript_14539/g.16495 Transcript_14539/m.16495 type:complete len:142 (-) Transcript_14539:1283-1708(-)